MKLIALISTSGICCLAAMPHPVFAQEANQFLRDRNVAVTERGRPELEALGIRAGSVMIFPKLTADLGYDSNILASDDNEVSDTYVRAVPSVDIVSDWSRHSLTASAQAGLTRFADREDENNETWRLSSVGRIDVQRQTQVVVNAEYGRSVEPRTASNTPDSIDEPIHYDNAAVGSAITRSLNRLRATGRVEVREVDYRDGRTGLGAVVDQDDRDQTTYEGQARLDYAISPATAVFGRVVWNARRFDATGEVVTPNRDSQGVDAIVGLNFELSNLIRGEAGVGFLRQEYDNPLYGELSGLSANARLEYFATPLITLGLVGDRSVGDSGIEGTAGFLSTTMQLTADYEFRRNIILGARIGRATEEFDTIDRENTRYFGGLRGTYLLNRRLGLTATYDFETRDSTGLDAINDFTANRLLLSVVAQY